jgi:hypothetical protein
MSTRLGMADGRCFTISTASALFNNYVMDTNGIPLVDNYRYRQFLQSQGPAAIERITGAAQNISNKKLNGSILCNECDTPLLKVPNTY